MFSRQFLYLSISLLFSSEMNLVLSLSRWFPKTTNTKFNSLRRVVSLKGGALPESEELRVFYALGVNVGRQVGFE